MESAYRTPKGLLWLGDDAPNRHAGLYYTKYIKIIINMTKYAKTIAIKKYFLIIII